MSILKVNTLNKGLVGHWRLDEASLRSATEVADATPYSNHGTITVDDLLAGWDFTAGWQTIFGGTIDDANSWTTDVDGSGVKKSGIITIGKKYRLRIIAPNSTGQFRIGNNQNERAYFSGIPTPLDRAFDFTGVDDTFLSLYSTSGNVTVDITKLELFTSFFVPDRMGQAGRAYNFDGADTTIPTSLTSNTVFQNGFSLSVWINPRTTGEDVIYGGKIIDKSQSTTTTDGFTYSLTSDNRIYVRIDNGTSNITPTNSISLNTWQHVAVTVVSDGTVTHYIDGVVSGTPATSGIPSDIVTSNPLTIGNRSTTTAQTFDGSMFDAHIYNRVLSQTEITLLFQLYRPGLRITA